MGMGGVCLSGVGGIVVIEDPTAPETASRGTRHPAFGIYIWALGVLLA
jgi:hypothetical protein